MLPERKRKWYDRLYLMIENQRLTEEINSLRQAHKSGSSLGDDESFLDCVETTFRQFSSFIDTLTEAGLGQLVTIAGLDLSQMPVINRNTNSSNNGLRQNFPPFGGSKSNGGTSNGRFGQISPSNSMYTAASFQNSPVGPADFENSQHKPTGQTAALPGDSSTVASRHAAGSALPELTRSQYLQNSIYDEESDTARQEADELYSRLVKDTLVGLGQADEPSDAGAARCRHRPTVGRTQDLAEDNKRPENASFDFTMSATRDSFDTSRVPPRGDSQLDSRNEESDDDDRYTSERRKPQQKDTKKLGSPQREVDSGGDDF